nr:UvrD-like helicase, ATP-binding domain, P-loop containing nucleoside triphosphate hydrolase [Tanacetum cinerariifolium]
AVRCSVLPNFLWFGACPWMGDRRSKEDYVHQISMSIYVTNFPEQFSFRDLWKKCQEYERVIDVYIPNRRTKSALKGKVANFGLLTNLKTVLTKEGFERFNLKYLGGFWVLIEFCTKELLENFKSRSWIVVFFFGEEPKHDNKSNFEEGEIQLEDPFHIYDLLVTKTKNNNKEEESSKATLKYPPGFTLDDVLRTKDVQDVDDVVEVQENTQKSNKQDNFNKDNNFRGVTHYKEEDKESFCSGQFRRSVGPQTSGSILQVMEDLVTVGQTMGYKMEGCVSYIEEIIRIHGENESYQ